MDQTEFQIEYGDLAWPDPPAGTWGWFRKAGTDVFYSVIDHLAQGAFGNVFLAINEYSFQVVALKLLRRSQTAAQPVWDFAKEQRLSRMVSSRNESRWIVPTTDTGYFTPPAPPGQNTLFLAMNHVPGRTLRIVLNEWKRLPVEEVLRIGLELCLGLNVLHGYGSTASSTILHRDLKPGNLIFDSLAHGEVRIADLGLAIEASSDTRGIHGTAEYLAPEIWRNERATIASDLYSLGCILYEMLRGKVPIHLSARRRYLITPPTDPQQAAIWAREDNEIQFRIPDMPGLMIPGVPRELDELVLSLLSKNPLDRPSSAAVVHDWLSSIQAVYARTHRQAVHQDWPRARGPSVVERLKRLASDNLNLPPAWLQRRAGLIAGLCVRLSMSLDALHGIERMTTDIQLMIGHVDVSWAAGFDVHSTLEARRTIHESFREAISITRPLKGRLDGLSEFQSLVDKWQTAAKEFHDECLEVVDRNEQAELKNRLFLFRSLLIQLQREAVRVYSMASDRLLSEVIRR
jgi:serine/threonine-protein kinase